MEELTDEELEKIKESVKKFINIIDVNNSESPTKQISIVEEETEEDLPREYRTTEETVPKPSKLVDNYKEIGIFDEVTELLIENGTFPRHHFIIQGQNDSSLPQLRVAKQDASESEARMKDALRNVAGATMDYNQGIEFSEDAFRDAIRSRLRPWLLPNPETHILIPLYGVDNIEREFNLEPPETDRLEYTILKSDSDSPFKGIEDESEINQNLENAADIEITEITISSTDMKDLTAIELSDSDNNQTNRWSFPSHKITIELNALTWQKIADGIAEVVATILRMADPFSEYTTGEAYGYSPHDYSLYDKEIPKLRKRRFSTSEVENENISQPEASIDSDDIDKIKSMWDDLHEYHPLSLINNEDLLSRPIQRFNQMYEKSRKEDAIIDCVIGLESTLIKDGGRVQERGVVLLEDDEEEPDFIYDYLGELWDLRNDIVHTDQEISTCTVDGDELTPEEVLSYARYFLSRIIQEYANIDQENPEKNITQINQKVIGPKIATRLTDVE